MLYPCMTIEYSYSQLVLNFLHYCMQKFIRTIKNQISWIWITIAIAILYGCLYSCIASYLVMAYRYG